MQLKPTLALKQKRLLAITPELRQAIGLMQMGAADLSRFIHQQCTENPLLKASRQEDHQVRQTAASVGGTNAPREHTKGAIQADRDMPDWLDQVSDKPGLYEHVSGQLGYCGLTAAEMPAARSFIESLEPSGWLGTDIEQVAEQTGCSRSTCKSVLRKLQKIEPTGLFARNLSECLRLQLEENGALDAFLRVVLDNLPELADLGPDRFAEKYEIEPERILRDLAVIRTLDPKPGSSFGGEQMKFIIPDLIAEKKAGRWFVKLNGSALPTIEIDADLSRQLSAVGKDEGETEQFKKYFGSARWVLKAIQRRQETLLRIGTELIRHQSTFLDQGAVALRPLLQKEIAEKIGVSESTISRVSNAVYIQTPRSIYPLKRFFCRGMPVADLAENWSVARIQQKIRDMIDKEDASRPLSDNQIAERLNRDGIEIARRTVAKYRTVAGVPGRAKRRVRVTH